MKGIGYVGGVEVEAGKMTKRIFLSSPKQLPAELQ